MTVNYVLGLAPAPRFLWSQDPARGKLNQETLSGALQGGPVRRRLDFKRSGQRQTGKDKAKLNQQMSSGAMLGRGLDLEESGKWQMGKKNRKGKSTDIIINRYCLAQRQG